MSPELCKLESSNIVYILENDPRKRGIDAGAILGWVGNDIAIIAILL